MKNTAFLVVLVLLLSHRPPVSSSGKRELNTNEQSLKQVHAIGRCCLRPAERRRHLSGRLSSLPLRQRSERLPRVHLRRLLWQRQQFQIAGQVSGQMFDVIIVRSPFNICTIKLHDPLSDHCVAASRTALGTGSPVPCARSTR